ncbi:MAG: AAA family ATPase [Candidatus Thiodiazotropha endolucinida]
MTETENKLADLHFPVLCWRLPNKTVCGLIVGTELEMIAENTKRLKGIISAGLNAQRQKHRDFELDIEKAALKQFNIRLQPAYHTRKGVYPAGDSISLPVAAVAGEATMGGLVCYLPLLGISFFYDKPEQLPDLVSYFVRNRFRDTNPEEMYCFRLPDVPWLEDVVIRGRPKQLRLNSGHDLLASLEVLPSLAERLPYTRKLKQSLSVMPTEAWERSGEVQDAVEQLANHRSCLLLVGPSGVGKSTVLADAIRQAHRPKGTKQRRWFWRTTSQRIIANSRYLGEWQQAVEDMVEELDESNGVLWVDDPINLLETGGSGPEDSVAQFLLPYMKRGTLQLIGEITPKELDSMRQSLPDFTGHFRLLNVEPMESASVQRVMEMFRDYLSRNHNLDLELDALDLAYRLTDRHLKYEHMPGKLIHFLGECINDAWLNKAKHISSDQVMNKFVQTTGLAPSLVLEDVGLNLEELTTEFSSKVIGQPAAIQAMCDVIALFKTGLNDPEKPITTMLFAGPTGVGKTASTRALAQYFFGQGQTTDPLIRLDMSELQSPAQVERLIGVPGGAPGTLIQQLRDKPFSVLLLDEIEKAHSAFFDLLLTVLDEGILVDGQGRETNCRNTIIIMTSNLGATAGCSIGFNADSQPDYNAEIRRFFRPEFFNRIDRVVTFNPLDEETVRAIVEKELGELHLRDGIAKRGIKLKFTDAVTEFLLETGFDPRYGARPLQRAIDRYIVSEIAQYLVENPKISNTMIMVKYLNKQVFVQQNQ